MKSYPCRHVKLGTSITIGSPEISIVVPTFNRAHLLPRLFRSLLRQTDRRFELLVVDDGSTDHTMDVVGEFSDQFGNQLIIIQHPGNRGCNAARNTGVRAARTNWCLFVDSDDELFDDSVHWAIHYTFVPKDVAAVGFLSVKLPSGQVKGYRVSDQGWDTAVIPYKDVVLKEKVTGDLFWMVRRCIFCQDGLWLPEFVNGLEQLFGTRLAKRKRLMAVRHVLGIVHFNKLEVHTSAHRHHKWPSNFRQGYEIFINENYDVLRCHVQWYRFFVRRVIRCSLYSHSYWRALTWIFRLVYSTLYLLLGLSLPKR